MKRLKKESEFLINKLEIGYSDKCDEFKALIEDLEIKFEHIDAKILQETKENYQSMINNLDVGYYKGEVRESLLVHNQKLNEYLGLDPSISLVGSKASHFFANLEEQEKYYNELIKNGFVKDFLIPVKKPNGEKIILQLNSHLIRNKENEPIKVEGTFIDITEKFRIEQKLRESEEKFRTITEQNLMGIFIIQDGKIKYCNQAISEISEYSQQEMMSWEQIDFVALIHPDDVTFVKEQLQKKQSGINNGIVIHYSYRIITKSQKIRWVDQYSKTILYEGKPADFVTLIDITNRKMAEQKLKESEEKYRHLFQSSPNAIVLTNKEGIIVDCNLATEKTFGYTKEELMGTYYNDLAILIPDQHLCLSEIYENLRKGIEVKPVELKIKKKDGSTIWIYYQRSLILLDGEILVESIGQDIADKKKAEEIIKAEIEKLKELDQIKSDFIDRASHELKTPLISIYGASTYLLDYCQNKIDNKSQELLEIIKRGGDRLLYIINNLLDTSRLEAGKVDLNKQKENIVKLIYECVNELKYVAEEPKLKFNLEIQEDVYLEVDKLRFEQVILNIVSNAIKNTPPDGNISITLQKYETSVNIIIKDTGVGFTESEKTKIFKKFGKIERYGKGLDVDIQGSGLGLYISKKIIELHKGQIWIESEGKNKGTKVIVKLPIN